MLQTASHATRARVDFLNYLSHCSAKMAPRTRSRLHNQSSKPIKTVEKTIVEDDEGDQPIKDATEQHADTSTSHPLGPDRQSKHKSKTATMTDRLTKLIPSSLPPSSPPSTSSQLHGSYQFPEIRPIPSDPACHQESDENDPFGFFAAERKLKQMRPPTVSREPMTFDSAHSLQDHGNSIQQAAFVSPKPTDPLRTPRKRTRAVQRSFMASSPSVEYHKDEDEEPMMSTPSPTKPRMLSYDARSDDSEKENVNVTGKRMGRKKAKVEKPRELAGALGARLPRWLAKEQKTRGQPRKTVEGDDDGDNDKVRKSGGVRRKAKHVPTVDVEDSDEEGNDEKQVRERQARIDYFKRLDGYKVQMEKVFVV